MGKKLTNQEALENCIKTHGDRYDYSKFNYIKSEIKITVICKTHGPYLVGYSQHVKGQNCKKCMYEGERIIPIKSNKKLFIENSNKIHNFKYDYSLVRYKNNKCRVKIICPIHGEFEQKPNSHLSGYGCIKCSGTYQYNLEDFVNKSIEKHGNKYNYSKVNYINNDIKVKIICNNCNNIFNQAPKSHLRGRGCGLCSHHWISNELIEKFNKVHNYQYLYDLPNTIIDSVHSKIKIFCKKHNDYYEQKITDHIRGCGCPICYHSKGENKIMEWLKIKQIKYNLQHRFNDCKNPNSNYTLPFDFYLPKLNICIEYDGEQHFKVVRFRKMTLETAKLNFEKLKIRDQIKTDYCNLKGIKLLRIAYSDFNRIEDILQVNIK